MIKTLIVNTYAGSLLLGANALKGARIIGSYEDCGFGANITKANRARFDQTEPGNHFFFIDHLRDWPDQDLTDVVVLAHPPCAAFSQQNTSKAKRGVNTDAFDCTRKVLRYAMSNNAAAIAVESVPGALGGAWDVHERFAEVGGYHVYRVLQNAILFGVPQFRERFWVVFVRKGLAAPNMNWVLSPRIVSMSATIDHLLPGTPIPDLQKSIDKFVAKLEREQGLNADAVRSVGLAHQTGWRRRSFSALVGARWFPDVKPALVCRRYISRFSSGQPSILAEYGYAAVLLGSSLWVYKGAPLPEEAYKAIMGFPPDYIFPEKERPHMRTFLSKGVCPPVATWVLDNILGHLQEQHQQSELTRADAGYVLCCQPNHVVSFKPSKKDVIERLEEMHRLGSPESDELLPLRGEEAE